MSFGYLSVKGNGYEAVFKNRLVPCCLNHPPLHVHIIRRVEGATISARICWYVVSVLPLVTGDTISGDLTGGDCFHSTFLYYGWIRMPDEYHINKLP